MSGIYSGGFSHVGVGVGAEETVNWFPLAGLGGVGVADPGVLRPGSRGCLDRFIFFS